MKTFIPNRLFARFKFPLDRERELVLCDNSLVRFYVLRGKQAPKLFSKITRTERLDRFALLLWCLAAVSDKSVTIEQVREAVTARTALVFGLRLPFLLPQILWRIVFQRSADAPLRNSEEIDQAIARWGKRN